MKDTARAAAKLGVDMVVGFTGSSIWKYVAMFPPVPGREDRGRLPGLRRPVEPDPRRLRRGGRALRPRGPPERDRLRLLDDRAHAGGDRPPPGLRPQLGPSHMVWQDLDPVAFIWDFQDRIYHVDCKDAKRVGNGRNGRLGSHLPWADPRRGWDFVSTGHGRRAVGGLLPDAQHDRVRRPDLGGVGGRRHGPARRRRRGAGLRAPARLRPPRAAPSTPPSSSGDLSPAAADP